MGVNLCVYFDLLHKKHSTIIRNSHIPLIGQITKVYTSFFAPQVIEVPTNLHRSFRRAYQFKATGAIEIKTSRATSPNDLTSSESDHSATQQFVYPRKESSGRSKKRSDFGSVKSNARLEKDTRNIGNIFEGVFKDSVGRKSINCALNKLCHALFC